MSDHLIEVGISSRHGVGDTVSHSAVVAELVQTALRSIDTKRLPVRCVLLFATPDWCQSAEPLPGAVRSALRSRLHYDVPLIGGSVPEMYCSTDQKPHIRRGLAMVALCTKELWMSVESLEKPYEGSERERHERLDDLAGRMEHRAWSRLGASAERALFGILPGPFLDPSGQLSFRDFELYEDILAAFEHRYFLNGASAADAIPATTGYQFADDRLLENGLALAIYQHDLKIATMMAHGFTARPGVHLMVDEIGGGESTSYDVTKLDGIPAAERVNQLAVDFTSVQKPVFGAPFGGDHQLVIPLGSFPYSGSSIRFSRKVAVGDVLYQLQASLQQANAAGDDVISHTTPVKDESELSLLFGFACLRRSLLFDDFQLTWRQRLDEMKARFPGVPLLALLSSAEFGLDRNRYRRANHLSVSLTSFSDRYAPRAKARELQRKLLKAESALTACESPRQVMQAALDGADSSGATGGQVCVVERSFKKILGSPLGAFLNSGNPHPRWDEIHLQTRLDAVDEPEELPSELYDYAIPVGPIATSPSGPTKSEDILTLAMRTRYAIYVEDSSDPRFRRYTRIQKAGPPRVQVAIPLLAPKGRVIALLQLSFLDIDKLDRESFAMWVAYGDKVAEALHRAQAEEERQTTQKISSLSNQIMQRSMDQPRPPEQACQDFLNKVGDLLGADYVHMRIQGPEGGMRLVAPVGPIGDLHRLTRPVTRAEDGSADSQALVRGPRVTNTREETVKFIGQVRALENVEKLPALQREFRRFGSSGTFPVRGRGDLLHSFTVHSVPEYFFTESKQRVTEAAADALGAVYHAAKAEYDRERRNQMRQFLKDQQDAMLSPSIIEHEHRGGAWLKQTLQRCADQIRADWASLFVWYEELEKLVLFTSYNWNQPMEGVAFYALDEGWTGRVANGEQDVVILAAQTEIEDQTTNRYLEWREPPEWRRKEGEPYAPHIGIRLHAGSKSLFLKGVVVFGYYSAHADRLGQRDHVLTDFLQSMGQLLTFGVFWAQSESLSKRADELSSIRSRVSQRLLGAVSIEIYQKILDEIQTGFSVEKVYIHWVREKRIERGLTSPKTRAQVTDSLLDPYGLLRELVMDKKEVEIRDDRDPRLNSWPDRNGIKALFAIPVLQPDGAVCAVLAFANRINTVDHPFEFLDAQEKAAARQIAEAIGIAIGVTLEEQKRSELTTQLATAVKIGAAGLYGGLLLHELKTPLGIIRISSDMLHDFPPKDAAERELYFVQIKASCDRAVRIINDAANRGAQVVQLVPLRTLVREAVRVIEPEIPFTQITLTVDNKLTDAVKVNLYMMVGALVNVLRNAVEAMRGTRGQLTITTEYGSQERLLLIRIHNTGPSLREDDIPGLFEPGITTKRDGLGIGLPLAKRAIEQAGGDIEMYPAARGGVEVVVALPSAEQPAVLPTKEAK